MAITVEQAVAMMQALRAQVEDLANRLDHSRQETADLRSQTDRSIQALQDQCDAARAGAKVEAVGPKGQKTIEARVIERNTSKSVTQQAVNT